MVQAALLLFRSIVLNLDLRVGVDEEEVSSWLFPLHHLWWLTTPMSDRWESERRGKLSLTRSLTNSEERHCMGRLLTFKRRCARNSIKWRLKESRSTWNLVTPIAVIGSVTSVVILSLRIWGIQLRRLTDCLSRTLCTWSTTGRRQRRIWIGNNIGKSLKSMQLKLKWGS